MKRLVKGFMLFLERYRVTLLVAVTIYVLLFCLLALVSDEAELPFQYFIR